MKIQSTKELLLTSARSGDLMAVQEVIDAGEDVNIQDGEGATPLWIACQAGHMGVVAILLAAGADVNIPNNDGWTSLFAASEKGYKQIVAAVLGTSVNVDRALLGGTTPLWVAANYGYAEIVVDLLNAGANPDNTARGNMTPLWAASASGYIDVVTALIAVGANKDTPNHSGKTPIYIASKKGHIDVVTALIAVGADVNTPDHNGWTPLNSASMHGRTKVVAALIAAGADVNILNKNNWTPLNSSSVNGYADVVAALIAAGADMNIPNHDGWTPLYAACKKGHTDVVAVLIAAGADMDIPTNSGKTPLSIAKRKGYVKIVTLLIIGGVSAEGPEYEGYCVLLEAAGLPLHTNCFRLSINAIEKLRDVDKKLGGKWQTIFNSIIDYKRNTVAFRLAQAAEVFTYLTLGEPLSREEDPEDLTIAMLQHSSSQLPSELILKIVAQMYNVAEGVLSERVYHSMHYYLRATDLAQEVRQAAIILWDLLVELSEEELAASDIERVEASKKEDTLKRKKELKLFGEMIGDKEPSQLSAAEKGGVILQFMENHLTKIPLARVLESPYLVSLILEHEDRSIEECNAALENTMSSYIFPNMTDAARANYLATIAALVANGANCDHAAKEPIAEALITAGYGVNKEGRIPLFFVHTSCEQKLVVREGILPQITYGKNAGLYIAGETPPYFTPILQMVTIAWEQHVKEWKAQNEPASHKERLPDKHTRRALAQLAAEIISQVKEDVFLPHIMDYIPEVKNCFPPLEKTGIPLQRTNPLGFTTEIKTLHLIARKTASAINRASGAQSLSYAEQVEQGTEVAIR